MHVRLSLITVALMASTTSTWANTSIADVYGNLNIPVTFPAHETYSAAADLGTNFFSYDPTYTPLQDITTTPGATAHITGAGYTASASTTLGSNHAYASASTTPSNILGTGSYSGWYDTVTINGGSGTGVMHFTVQLNGTVDAGAIAGLAAYGLYASSVHPAQLANDMIVNYVPLPTNPWFLDGNGITTIAGHTIGISPYNDTSLLYTTEIVPPLDGILGIPALESPQILVDQILAPGDGQNINVTLHGTLNFTYGEAFYLIGGLGMGVGGIEAFCAFTIDGSCGAPPIDGTGATTLDFSNSANLINIALPEGATASFASGTAYNVTAVPEPAEWLMLLAGLGLVGWRVRRRS